MLLRVQSSSARVSAFEKLPIVRTLCVVTDYYTT
jgi:hypothetical protein